MRIQLEISIATILILIIGCGKSRPDKYYYRTVANRGYAIVKFEKSNLDIYQLDLKAILERAIDVTNADTAEQIHFEEIQFPKQRKSQYFQAVVDMLDYQNMVNAVKNFISMKDRVDGPLFYSVNDDLQMVCRADSGLTLKNPHKITYSVPDDSIKNFLDFLDELNLLVKHKNGKIPSPKIAQVENLIAQQSKEKTTVGEKKMPLEISDIIFKISKKDEIMDRCQVDCQFWVQNPNRNVCKFETQILFQGKKEITIHSFVMEQKVIGANSKMKYIASTVIRLYEAERIQQALVEIFNVIY
jgi:hypothetical protein